TDPDTAKRAVEGRPLTLEFVAASPTGASRVACEDVAAVASRQIGFARAAIPVASPGILASISCGELPPLDADEDSIMAYLRMLDWLARHSDVDVMVAVVPGGWLTSAAGGAVGVAANGLRAVIIEQSAPAMTTAHEVSHTFGVMHNEGDTHVTGVRV